EIFLDRECVIICHRLLLSGPPETAGRCSAPDIAWGRWTNTGEVRIHIRVPDNLSKVKARTSTLNSRSAGSLVKDTERGADGHFPVARWVPRQTEPWIKEHAEGFDESLPGRRVSRIVLVYYTIDLAWCLGRDRSAAIPSSGHHQADEGNR